MFNFNIKCRDRILGVQGPASSFHVQLKDKIQYPGLGIFSCYRLNASNIPPSRDTSLCTIPVV